jgi:cis-3-alkyl-4-acyloxetan-2-one decarboxylase
MSAPPSIPPWLERMYPFAPRSFEAPGGGRMSFVDEGPRGDEAVLMLHGNPTWSFHYRDLVKALAPGLRCIAPDHVGMGLSEKPAARPYTLESRIADIAALVENLGLRRVHLVVHDWGGAIGMGWAARHPGLVGRIVILNTAAFPSPDIPLRIALCRTPVLGEWLVRGLNGFAGPATWMAMKSRRLTPDERRAYLLPYDSWANRVAVHRFVRDIPMGRDHPSRPILERTAAALPSLASHPILIQWGGRDFCFNDRFLARWREIYPEAACERHGDLGHYVLEDGGERVRGRICAFLRGGPV